MLGHMESALSGHWLEKRCINAVPSPFTHLSFELHIYFMFINMRQKRERVAEVLNFHTGNDEREMDWQQQEHYDVAPRKMSNVPQLSSCLLHLSAALVTVVRIQRQCQDQRIPSHHIYPFCLAGALRGNVAFGKKEKNLICVEQLLFYGLRKYGLIPYSPWR